VVDTIPVGDGPRGLAITAQRLALYVANANDDTVSVIDSPPATHRHLDRRHRRRRRRCADARQRRLYVSNSEDRDGRRCSTSPGRARARSRSARPRAIAFTPDGGTCLRHQHARRHLSPINTATEMAGTPIEVGGPDRRRRHRRRQHRLRRQPSGQHALDPRRRNGRRDDAHQPGAPFDLALGSCPLLPTPTATFTTTTGPSVSPTRAAAARRLRQRRRGQHQRADPRRNIALGNNP
jgi:hypothetical protein